MDREPEPTERERRIAAATPALDALLPHLQARLRTRWAGAWIERKETLPSVGVAVVRPTAEEVIWISEAARSAGWLATTFCVPHGMSDLERFQGAVQALMGTDDGSASSPSAARSDPIE